MSKFAFIALLLIFNSAFGSKVFLGNTNKMTVGAFAQLQKIETTSFGKNLLDTIALQVSNKAPLSEVAKLLAELKSDLQHQQAEDDLLHQQRETECESDIAEYNRRIAVATSEIAEATSRIGQLTNRIAELEIAIETGKQNIQETEQSIADAIAFRATRAGQFESRTLQHQSVVEALDLILEKLNAYGTQAASDEQVLLQLAKIGNSNPIAAFVQVAAALPAESWNNVLSKLSQLRDATAASLVEDAEQERLEIIGHQDLLTSLNHLLDSLRTKLAQDEQELVEQRADLAEQTIRLNTNVEELKNASEGKAAKEAQCEQWRQQYFADSKQRAEEISIVEQVQEIFAQRLDTAEGYLRERMEADRVAA
jgi:septal ring factor EnvC (AmiA/AmiB activator)